MNKRDRGGEEARRTIHADLPLVFEITLVGDHDDRESVLIFDTKDLLVESADFLERVSRGNGVHEQETFARAHVLFPHRTASCF